jgi:ubiquinone biosynthesis protein Coq4
MCAGAAVFGPLRFTPKQKLLFFGRVRPWAIRVGTQAHFLLNVFYEDRWEQNLDDFRREMSIEPPPYMSMMNPSIKKTDA